MCDGLDYVVEHLKASNSKKYNCPNCNGVELAVRANKYRDIKELFNKTSTKNFRRD